MLEFDGLHKRFGGPFSGPDPDRTRSASTHSPRHCSTSAAGVSRVIFSSHQLERVERLRQEDLGIVVMPTTLVQAAADPGGALAVITSYVPGLSPLVMPVRQAAGQVVLCEMALAVVLMLVAIGLIVRLGGRIYAGALLRTSGKTKLREALKAERV